MVYVIKEWGVICCAGTRSTAVVRGSMQGHAHPRKVVKKVTSHTLTHSHPTTFNVHFLCESRKMVHQNPLVNSYSTVDREIFTVKKFSPVA